MNKIDINVIRHSAAHVLAQAVLIMFPSAKLGIGPAIENGFYYDFDLDHSLTEQDLEKLESLMKKIINEKQSFSVFDLNYKEALNYVSEQNQPYKIELIKDLNMESYSFYKNGPFVDLCKGPHVETTKDINAVKLLSVAGAYWRGSEKNKMLQRIYGTAFANPKELRLYLKQIEEAKARDHRLIGKQLNLFSIKEEVGGGLVLWHPKGSMIRHLLEDYWKSFHIKTGYELVYTPHLGKSGLWEKSGHLSFYNENMYAPMSVDETNYFLKPMNCPFHILIYKDQLRSYRDLPLRYAELGTVYRFERSGVLHGLFRVRGFTQDDAHIICTKDQINEEIVTVIKHCQDMLAKFDFKDIELFISTKPKEKSVGSETDWKIAESALIKAVESLGLTYEIDEGGGAFYGPKIDIKIKDALGRKWQCSTIQFDFNLPEKLDMSYIGSDGNPHRPYMIHRALLGSIERFFGILVEHYNGKFPLWLAPTQITILSIAENYTNYCISVQNQLKDAGFRVDINISNDKIGYKVRQAIEQKIPYLIILGKNESDSNTLAIRQRGKNNTYTTDLNSFIEKLKLEQN